MNVDTARDKLLSFAPFIRSHGFPASTDQVIDFLRGIKLLGPGNVEDIRKTAIAVLYVPREREHDFNRLFDAHFLGRSDFARQIDEEPPEEVQAYEQTGQQHTVPEFDEEDRSGSDASMAERLAGRRFAQDHHFDTLNLLSRHASHWLPKRQSYRYSSHHSGRSVDLRRTLHLQARHDGDVIRLVWRRRKERQRQLLMLIDVSRSMEEHTEWTMRLAHKVADVADNFEAFTLGTRLTRISKAISIRNRDRALHEITHLVADIDGGTRIGQALQTLLAIPRYSSLARGAYVLVVSDGLEKGSPDEMVDGVYRLSRLAWRMDWLTPLAGDSGYRPETSGLRAIMPYLDAFGDASSIENMVNHLLGMRGVQ